MKNNKKFSMEDVLLSAFVGVESAHSFSAFNPSIFTIQAHAVPEGNEGMIRQGYIPSVAFSIVLGGIVGAIRKTWLPVAFGLGTSGFMIFVYEMAIRGAQAKQGEVWIGSPIF